MSKSSTRLVRSKLLLAVSRPLFWVSAPVIWTSGFVHSGANFHIVRGVVHLAALSLPTCLVTFGVNDVYDHHSDVHNGRKNSQWADGTVLEPVRHDLVLRAARVSTLLVVISAFPVSVCSLEAFGYTLAFLALIWMYSAPPVRFKERPVVDSLSNGMICWLFWACGYTFDGHRSLMINPHQSAGNGRLVFLFASALHSLAAMLDRRADALAGYQTIGTVRGGRYTALFPLTCFCTATVVVGPWSLVGLATSAGAITSVILFLVPEATVVLVRLSFLGSYLGSLLWVLKAIWKTRQGHDIGGDW